MRLGVKKGMLLRKPKWAALRSVCMGGQKNAWCMNFTRLLRCVIVWTLCTWFGVGDFSVARVGVAVMGKCQSRVFGSRVPVRRCCWPS